MRRDDGVAESQWRRVKQDLEDRKPAAQVRRDCSRLAINRKCLSSPPNILWEFLAFSTVLQLVVDIFHNIHEGHANLLYGMFRVFTAFASVLIKASWNDPEVWDPSTGETVNFSKSQVNPHLSDVNCRNAANFGDRLTGSALLVVAQTRS